MEQLQITSPATAAQTRRLIEIRREERERAELRASATHTLRAIDRLLGNRADSSPEKCPYCQSGSLYAARPAGPCLACGAPQINGVDPIDPASFSQLRSALDHLEYGLNYRGTIAGVPVQHSHHDGRILHVR